MPVPLVSTLLSQWAEFPTIPVSRLVMRAFFHQDYFIIENQVWKRGSSEDGSSSEVLKPPFVLELNRYFSLQYFPNHFKIHLPQNNHL